MPHRVHPHATHFHPVRKKAIRYVRAHLLVVLTALAACVVVGILFTERVQYLSFSLTALTPTPVVERSPLLKTLGTIQWQQYEDPENGYMVKYPPHWTFLKEEAITSFGIGDSPEKWVDIGYQIIILTESADAQTFTGTIELKKAHFAYRPTFSEEYVLVDGTEAVTLTDDGSDWPRITTYVHRNGILYTLTLVYFSESLVEGDALYPEARLTYE